MRDLRIRQVTAADAPAVEKVVELAYEPYVARIGRRPAPMEQDYGELLQNAMGWVAEVSGAVVGVAIVVERAGALLLENVAVLPSAQGHGVGGMLLSKVEEHAAADGLRRVDLYTNEAMTENLAMYARRGYRETAREEQDGFRRVFFSKEVGTGDRRPGAQACGLPSEPSSCDFDIDE